MRFAGKASKETENTLTFCKSSRNLFFMAALFSGQPFHLVSPPKNVLSTYKKLEKLVLPTTTRHENTPGPVETEAHTTRQSVVDKMYSFPLLLRCRSPPLRLQRFRGDFLLRGSGLRGNYDGTDDQVQLYSCSHS